MCLPEIAQKAEARWADDQREIRETHPGQYVGADDARHLVVAQTKALKHNRKGAFASPEQPIPAEHLHAYALKSWELCGPPPKGNYRIAWYNESGPYICVSSTVDVGHIVASQTVFRTRSKSMCKHLESCV